MANKRIIDQTTDTALSAGDMVIVDSSTEGTRKYDLGARLAEMGDLDDLDTTYKSDLVGAINEAAQSGGGGGGGASPYTSDPEALGTADPGSSSNYSRGDHVHPMPTASDVGAASEDELIDLYPTATASGEIASFSDGADELPVKSLMVGIEPIQSGSGDPSPDNIRPITGHTQAMVTRTGKNLFEPTTENTYKNDSGVWFNGTDISSIKASLNALPVGNYTISFKFNVLTTVSGAVSWGILIRNAVSGYIDGRINGQHNSGETLSFTKSFSVTEANKGEFVNAYMYSGGGSHADVYWYDFQLKLGTTATAYEPYNADTYAIDLDGTVYGGTLDVTSGVLTVDRAIVDLGTLSWSYVSNYGFFMTPAISELEPSADGICSMFAVVEYNASSEQWASGDMILNMTNVDKRLRVKDTQYTDAATFKTAVTGQTLVYILATPQTIQLTPHELTTLLGSNNIWSDAGDVEVEYRANGSLMSATDKSRLDDLYADYSSALTALGVV